MRNVVAVLALAMAGCAASPRPHAAAAPDVGTTAPHPILAQAAPIDVGDAGPAKADEASLDQKPASEHSSRQMNRVWGWVALSVGAEGLILATVTSFMMLHENSVRNADCVNKVCSSDGIAANGKLGNLAGWNAAAWGVAAVGAGAGAFLLLTNPSDESLGTQIGVGPTASGSGLLLRGSF